MDSGYRPDTRDSRYHEESKFEGSIHSGNHLRDHIKSCQLKEPTILSMIEACSIGMPRGGFELTERESDAELLMWNKWATPINIYI